MTQVQLETSNYAAARIRTCDIEMPFEETPRMDFGTLTVAGEPRFFDAKWTGVEETRSTAVDREVAEFVRRRDLLLGLLRFVRLAQKRLNPLRVPVIVPQSDPESGDRWLVVRVAITGTAADIRGAYEQFISDACAQVRSSDMQYLRLVVEFE